MSQPWGEEGRITLCHPPIIGMGLSATPFRSDDDEIDSPFPDDAKERILDYYGPVVAEYSLGDAINDGVLCEYEYHVISVHLTEGRTRNI